MDSQELIRQAERIAEALRAGGDVSYERSRVQAREFLRVYAGTNSQFFDRIQAVDRHVGNYSQYAAQVMDGFVEYVRAGLATGLSPERKAQLDVVSDFLDQARVLLETKAVHPAAPAVIIGAALEEFLRTWVETAGISLAGRMPGLEAYAGVLREADHITKQDAKDITAWGGLRNHAAHGEWDQVADRQRIAVMMEGVNLFMRRYSGAPV